MGSSLRCACFSSVALVPVLEKIFWRGWLMRWSIDRNFLAVRLGTYQQAAVWLVAVLFACEHGLYWDVGLITGIVYNLWLIRTGTWPTASWRTQLPRVLWSLTYFEAGQWQYWL